MHTHYFNISIWTKVKKYTLGDSKMKRREALYHIDLMLERNTGEDKKALNVAKKSILKEYRFKFWANVIILIATIIIFGSFVLMTYFMYK
ncbi:TPA: hypothetical protein PTV34_003497 [Clostridium botulinum]|nr:hypothetical protein [Clostridium botulinum]